MSTSIKQIRKALVVGPSQGRTYSMGRMKAVFFADRDETDSRYSISEWWLEPRTTGPGTHLHSDDHIYYVLEGTVSIQIEDEWWHAERGSYALIPGGNRHNFENRSNVRCGFISINSPCGFESSMPGIVEWFAENPPGDVAG
jgi:mannose-6-phosphate isomerase-like protein (cupin superfamily)